MRLFLEYLMSLNALLASAAVAATKPLRTLVLAAVAIVAVYRAEPAALPDVVRELTDLSRVLLRRRRR